ncbi:MAG: M55 family metallopeptidase [Desulfobacter sp.]|nr:MAG: M55 family metallopeptidase [Desulfobacter sp.]
MKNRHFLIIADIEGSSGCRDRESASFMGRGWPRACREMTRDVNAAATALLNAGAARVCIQDFHRTGYNLMPRGIHPAARLFQGYRRGPVPGMGRVEKFHGLLMLGMHAPSGLPGFLSHTLTSRIAQITINGRLISEAQLFSAGLAPFGTPPLFFSGCPAACRHTADNIPGVNCFPIDKADPEFSPASWRRELAAACVDAASLGRGIPYNPAGPFRAAATWVQEAEARAVARRWHLPRQGRTLELCVGDVNDLFIKLSKMAYLSPLREKLLPMGLPLYHFVGRAALAWAIKKAPGYLKPEAESNWE